MKREIRYTAPRRIATGLIIWAAISGVFVYLSGTHLHEEYCFTHHAVPVTGIVEDKRFYAGGGARGGSVEYCIAFSYEGGNLHPLIWQDVPYAIYQDLKQGDSVPVLYLLEDPTKARINLPDADWVIHTNAYSLYLITSVVLLPGVFILWRLTSANMTWRRLKREGLMTPGVVKEIGVDYVGRQRTPNWFLILEYRTESGLTFLGKSFHLTNEQLMLWRPGTQLEVWYDRNKPRLFLIDVNAGRTDMPDANGSPNNRASGRRAG